MRVGSPVFRDPSDPSQTFLPGIHMYAKDRASAGESRERDEEFYYLAFRLDDDFIRSYKTRQVEWGFPAGGNVTLGEITFYTKYSLKKLDGTKERWWEACRRVIEGMYSIQKEHCRDMRIPWNEHQAQTSAEEAYERLFMGKWTPPGRGLWKMGTFFVNGRKNSASLQNCSFISTKNLDKDSTTPFERLMEMCMLGIGVGFDTQGVGKVTLHQPVKNGKEKVIIDDSREGWCESLGLLLSTYFEPDRHEVVFDYSEIRGAGEEIKGFGGTSAGPEPLIQLHKRVRSCFDFRAGQKLTETDIVDVMNFIGKGVQAANVRSSAEIGISHTGSQEFLDLKNPFVNPERCGFKRGPDGGPLVGDNGAWINTDEGGWAFTSNNTIVARVGETDYEGLFTRGLDRGEVPGLLWLDLAREMARAGEPDIRDIRIEGVNPCAEQLLEDRECCTLAESSPYLHSSLDDYLRTLKFCYLYAKTVTLLSTHWEDTNAVMRRNHRIGTGMTGLATFIEHRGWSELREWQRAGYDELRKWDAVYSDWLCVRESVRVSTVKPSGSVSLLFGQTPGCHWPIVGGDYVRTMRFTIHEPIVELLREAGFKIEPNVQNPDLGVVVYFPTTGPTTKSDKDVSVWQKVSLAAECQRNWSDNSVSITATFRPEEASELADLVRVFEGKLKSLSFMPVVDAEAPFQQMPYSKVSADEFKALRARVKGMDWAAMYDDASSAEASGERGCTTDYCELDFSLEEGMEAK